MHGQAVASFAVGRTSGVAPGADLYYFASAFRSSGTFESVVFACLARSVERILAINAELPEAHKIRVFSMSIDWSPGSKGYEAMQSAARTARDAGLLVICSSVEEVPGFRFHGLGRDPLADPDEPESYQPVSGGPPISSPARALAGRCSCPWTRAARPRLTAPRSTSPTAAAARAGRSPTSPACRRWRRRRIPPLPRTSSGTRRFGRGRRSGSSGTAGQHRSGRS